MAVDRYRCPRCGSKELFVRAESLFTLNQYPAGPTIQYSFSQKTSDDFDWKQIECGKCDHVGEPNLFLVLRSPT